MVVMVIERQSEGHGVTPIDLSTKPGQPHRAGGTRFGLSVALMGSFASQGAMWPYMAVPPQESVKVDYGLPAIAVGMQIHLLILEGSPQPLHQDVVVAALPS
jgi:hypothetical protein